jgi:hypothetical protein
MNYRGPGRLTQQQNRDAFIDGMPSSFVGECLWQSFVSSKAVARFIWPVIVNAFYFATKIESPERNPSLISPWCLHRHCTHFPPSYSYLFFALHLLQYMHFVHSICSVHLNALSSALDFSHVARNVRTGLSNKNRGKEDMLCVLAPFSV